VFVSAGYAVLKLNIGWEKVELGHVHACLICISWMRSNRGGFMFLRLFIDDSVVPLKKLNIEVF